MKCPVCGKEARVRIYHCAKCGVYVHQKCWKKHVAEAHTA
jgi:hypothetical protein